MQNIHLDCSGLHNIRLEKGNLPDTIYIDGSQFLSNLERILDSHQASDVQEYERRLRDEFAAQAMQAQVSTFQESCPSDEIAKDLAEWSYMMADAMLKAREEK